MTNVDSSNNNNNNKMYVDKIISTLHARVGEEKTAKLLRAMEKDNAFISGSFILECIAGGFEAHDIDVFVPEHATALLEWRLREGDVNHSVRSPYTANFFSAETRVSVYDSTVNGHSLQLIVAEMSAEALRAAVFERFDLTFCKNILSIRDGKPLLEIFDIDSIATRRCTMGGFWRHPEIEIGRVLMYRRRGFTIEWKKADMVEALLHTPQTDDYMWHTKYITSDDARWQRFEGHRVYGYTPGSVMCDPDKWRSFNVYSTYENDLKKPCLGGCGILAASIRHVHVHSSNHSVPPELIVITRHQHKQTWNYIVDVVLALFPLALPPYVLLEILQWLPCVQEDLVDGWLSEYKAITLIIDITVKYRQRRAELRTGTNKAIRL